MGGGSRLFRLLGEDGEFRSGIYDVLLSVDRGEEGAIVGDATGIGGGTRLVEASFLGGSAGLT